VALGTGVEEGAVASATKGATKQKSTDDGASAAAYAREALSQWATAAKLGAAKLGAGSAVRSAKPDSSGRGRRIIGTMADWALSKGGPMSKAASKLSLGKRLIGDGPSSDGDVAVSETETEVSIPIQEGINVAVPIGLAYQLATEVDDYPTFLDHVLDVEPLKGNEAAFSIKLHGRTQQVTVDVFDRREDERIDWRGTDGIEHAGTVSFHELAPRLTRIELSIDLEPHGLLQKLSRATRLSNHAVASELRRFKAYAELYEGDQDEEFEPEEGEEAGEEPEEAETEEEAPAES
jgi:uncharacterized membrane protein